MDGHANESCHAVAAYVCPMCPGVESETPGTCPHCGMQLERTAPDLRRSTRYTCPMHPEVQEDGPGACPQCGMELEPQIVASEEREEEDHELRTMTRRFWAALALSLPVFSLAMPPMVSAAAGSWIAPGVSRWLQFLLSTPVVLFCGWPFFVRGWRSVMTWHLNMFTLIALGTGAAFSYSVVAVLFPVLIPEAFRRNGQVEVYFEAAVVITTLVLLGQVLELRARRRTGSAIRELLALAPPTARLVKEGRENEVSVDEVLEGNILKVVPGEKVPLDGAVIAGKAVVDESMLTGESVAVAKQPGDTVIGGTVNQTGAFEMRVTRVGEDTVLSQIVALVSEAQRSRAPIQRVADVVASWFVPAVVVVAAFTFLAWAFFSPEEPALAYALINAVSVLIIACPCALGLATPMSVVVGIGRGAKEGVLIKAAPLLEALEKVDTIVVDKTGTLTEGSMRWTQCVPTSESSEDECLRLAAAVEQNSEHPLGRALVTAAHERDLGLGKVEDFESVAGGGVAATVDTHRVLVGKREYLSEHGVAGLGALESQARELEERGETVVFVAVDARAAGLLAFSDPIKESTPNAVRELRRLGFELRMVTGDNERTARAVAGRLNIDHVEAGVSPQDKAAIAESLHDEGRTVLMAGDGINDAPALAAADVGVAMGTGTDVAIESAGITLVNGDLRGILRAVQLGRATMKNIRQNLFFALVYNAVGVPVAAGVLVPLFGMHALLSPMVAALAMSLSSVSVVANALRLKGAKLA